MEQTELAKYQEIALDIAAKIAHGQYLLGQKIYARSALAVQYQVSAETARRAICVLSDLNIAVPVKGSGVIIQSQENAIKFISQYENIKTIHTLQENILIGMDRQQQEFIRLKKNLTALIDRTERFRSTNPFTPFQIKITSKTPHLNQTSSAIGFWQHTKGTIIAIEHAKKLLMSPGPYTLLQENDTLYLVGDDTCFERVQSFLYPHSQS